MNFSRLITFLPLLMLLPATSSAAIVIPNSHLNPSELCPLVHIVQHELCVNQHHNISAMHHANNASDLCVLLNNYNTSFCSGENEKSGTNANANANAKSNPISYDVMSIRVLEHEYTHGAQDMHKVCPIINFIEQELCTSRNEEIKVRFDPKELCPLLNLTYTEFCE
jgi:hypothetical protein